MNQNLIFQVSKLKLQQIHANKIYSFLPYRKNAKEFDFNAVGRSVLSFLMGKEIKKSYTFEKFREACLNHLTEKLDGEDPASFVGELEKMYFFDRAITNIAPEFMLFSPKAKENSETKHLIALFASFFNTDSFNLKFDTGTNFIENIFLDILKKNFQEKSLKKTERCYLPFISKFFLTDLQFLSKHSDYFLRQLKNCMELYTFIYCAQLGLNIKNWKDGNQPKSRSLFFILDTEKASSERSNLKNYGFQNVLKSMANVFPILSILEYLNNDEEASKSPLWAFAQALNVASVEEERVAFNSICDFLEKFRKARNLPIIGRIPTNSIEALEKLIEYGIKQFEPGIGGKFSVKQKYVRFFERGVAKNFVRSRGRAGKVLVINQDFILLLTNLSIGDSKSMRFQELIYEFNQRGFYFDKISQETLIAFYERVGNVTRMSDSGDAVYVRSTI